MQTSLRLDDELRVLRGHAMRAGSRAEVLARQALRAADGGGLGVARAALDELLWRFEHASRGDAYIWSTDPLEASCSCEDFMRSSLGACVHVMAALKTPYRRLAPDVSWNPIRPLEGVGAYAERITRSGKGKTIAPAVGALRARAARLRVPRVDPATISAQLASLRLPLYPYQRAGVEAFFRMGRLVLADDMGLGKTAQAIAIAHVLFGLALISSALVIAPAALRGQWAAEWARFSDCRAQIVSYEQARRHRDDLATYELVILDEAQRIKNASTLTARELKQLQPRWRLALSGTPLENRLEELASITSWVDDLALEPTWRLRAYNVVRNDNNRVIGVRGLETIRARIAPYFLRRRRAEVIAQLPARRDTQVPLLMTPRQSELHDSLQLAIARIVVGAPLGREQYLHLQRLLAEQRLVCNGVALARFVDYWREMPLELSALHSPKLGALRELLASLVVQQGRKVVVFSQWRRMLQLAERTSADVLGSFASAYFTGDESPARRTDSLSRFHHDPNVRVLWSTDVGALGLNLQHAASCCINLELPWNPAVLEQRIARIHRIGQTEPVDVYNLVTIDGIEGRIVRLLDTKRAVFDGVFASDVDSIQVAHGAAPDALVLALATTPAPWSATRHQPPAQGPIASAA